MQTIPSKKTSVYNDETVENFYSFPDLDIDPIKNEKHLGEKSMDKRIDDETKKNSFCNSSKSLDDLKLKEHKQPSERKKLSLLNEPKNDSEIEFTNISKSDLTNRLIDILSEAEGGIICCWFLSTLFEIFVRINSFYFVFNLMESDYGHYYIILMFIPRGFYILIMSKLLFEENFDDIYVARVAKTINFIDVAEKKLQIFEYNLQNHKKKGSKNRFILNQIKTFHLKEFCKKTALILLPNELCFLCLFGYRNRLGIVIFLTQTWLYKSVEIYFLIALIIFMGEKEKFEYKLNYDFVSYVLMIADSTKFIMIVIILFIFNKGTSTSELLASLYSKDFVFKRL